MAKDQALLMTINKINRILLRENDLTKLMHGVSQLITENNLYSGCLLTKYIDKSLELIASSGYLEAGGEPGSDNYQRIIEFLKESNITNDLIIVEGKKSTFVDLNAKLGDHKIAIISINNNRNTIGYMCFSFQERRDFPEEEKKLIKSLAEDLGHITAKIETEESLKESEQLYRLLAENANDFILLHDLEGNIIFFNQAGIKLAGYTEEEIYDKSVQDLIAPDYITAMQERRNIRFHGNHSSKRYELEFFKKSGNKIPVEVVSTPFEKNGSIQGVLVIGRDITERKRAEKEREKNKRLLERTQEIAHLGSWEYDLKKEKLVWSKEVYRIFGCNPDQFEVTYENFMELVHPDDREKVDQAYLSSLEKGQKGYEIEHRIKKRDTGEIRYILEKCRHIKNDSGKILRSVGMANDITNLKNKELELRESEEKFRTLAETAPLAILVYRGDKWIYANSAAERICGYNLEELKEMNFWDIAAPDYRDLIKDRGFKRERGEPTPGSYEFKILTREGQEKWVYLNGDFIEIGGKPAGFITVLDITERKEAEEELLKHRRAMQASMDGMAILNAKGEYIYVNQAHIDIYGYNSKNDFLGRSWNFLYDRDERIRFKNEIIPEVNQKGFWNGMATGRKQDGTSFPQEISLSKLDDGGLICVVRDVTEQEEARKRLQFIHNIYRQTIVAAQEVPYKLNYKDKTYEFIGDNCQDLLGIPAGEIDLQKVRKLVKNGIVADSEKTDDYQEYNHLFKQGKIDQYKVELEIETPEGERKWISDRSLTLRDEKTGNVIGAMGILRDITEVKEYEKQLEYVHDIYRKTIENANGIPYRLSYNEGKYEYMGHGIEKVFGIDSREIGFNEVGNMVVDSRVLDTKGPDDLVEYGKWFKQGKLDKYNVELKIRLDEGEEKWVVDRSLPIKDSSGKVIGSMGIMQDVTERKKLEEQLLQSQKLESIGNLAAGVAHDFNNMLAVIKGRTQMALMNYEREDSVNEDLNEVLDAADRAAELTKQMLLFSRKKVMQFKPVNLNRTIKDLLKMLKRLIEEDIEIITKFDPEIWTIKADEVNLNQVIMNISINARDAMPSGGELYIKTKNVMLERSDLPDKYGVKTGRYVKLSIKDSGNGIDDDIIDKIFDPFFTTKGRAKGTGMGLAVVYGIIKKHDGFIDVNSKPDEGTSFLIYLPALDSRPGNKHPTTQAKNNKNIKGNGEHILFVEDNPDVTQTFKSFLNYGGYTMDAAETGARAMELFSKQMDKYELVISDIVLPDISGVELIDKLCQVKDISYLLVSGYPEDKYNRDKIQQKNIPFLQKPVDLNKLLIKIKEILNN